jgi:hypothetical protein
MRRECFCSLGLSASDRFLRHLPDFVRSLSFDHLPFLTVGTGKSFTLFGYCIFCFLPYIFSSVNGLRRCV